MEDSNMLKTYTLHPFEDTANTPEFEYHYPREAVVCGSKCYHIGLGLYIVEDGCTNVVDEMLKYQNLEFVCLVNSYRKSHEDKGSPEWAFVYSKQYSVWKHDIFYEKKNQLAQLQVPDVVKGKFDRVMHDLLHGSRSIRTYSWEDCWELPCAEDEINDLDLNFEYDKAKTKDSYILFKGRIGTKIVNGVYQFKAPLVAKEWELEKAFYPTIITFPMPGQGTDRINADCITLGKRIWSEGTISADMGREVHYILLGEGKKEKDKLVEFTDLIVDEHKKLDLDEVEYLQEDVLENIPEDGEKQVELSEEVLDCCEEEQEEVFLNVGFHGEWTIKYNKIFELKRWPHEIETNYVALKNGKLIYKERYNNKFKELDANLLRYLRVSYQSEQYGESIGHTFIEDSDEKEIALIGKEAVELYRSLS